jgi:hypothetical protein
LNFYAFPLTSKLEIWGRPTWIGGDFEYFNQRPPELRFHLSGDGRWRGGGSGTVRVEVVTARLGGHVYTGSATIRSGYDEGFSLLPVINPQIFLPPNPFAGAGFFDAQDMFTHTYYFKATATLSAPNGATATSVRHFSIEVWIFRD